MKPRSRPAHANKTTPAFFSSEVTAAKRFYLNLNPPKNRPLVVVCGGLEHCHPDYSIHRDTFPFYSIEYVARGTGQLELRRKTFALQPGRLFAYGPGIPHHIIGNTEAPLVKYFVDFVGTNATDCMDACGLAPGHVSEVFPANALQPLFDELILAGSKVQYESADLCARLLECLVMRIKGARTPLASTETLAFMTYQQCRRHIEQHCLRLRTLEQIATECHVNNAYLCRLFRRYDNQTPYQYLLRLKMNHAAERLEQPGALVKQVAEESGFTDPFHFSRLFTSIFGLSPSSFRRIR
jgi:AraC-like DNA-binding protein/quercetin dioxygenase-like cupin family protein